MMQARLSSPFLSPQDLWGEFIQANPHYGSHPCTVYPFGQGNAAALAGRREKSAVSFPLFFFETGEEPFPEPGHFHVVTDESGSGICVIRIIQVYEIPFSQVTELHVQWEAEGNRTLSQWKRARRNLFTRELFAYGVPFSEETPILILKFETVWSTLTRPSVS